MTNFKFTKKELLAIRVKSDKSLLFFTRFWFKILRGTKFIINHHHETICNELENVANYKYEFLNINIPPRYSKTELAGVNFIAWGLSKNPRSNWLYITASDELRSEVSIRIRDIVTHPLFYQIYGIQISKSQQGKNLWKTKAGGGLKTATIFGQITGFGAGQMTPNSELINFIREFEGGIVLDDINKIGDAITDSANNRKANERILNTILSRKNSQDTPLVNMQQRAGVEDATSTLLEHYKDSEKIKNLVMPIINDGIPLWAYKDDNESIKRLKNNPKTEEVFETQYMQNPTISKGALFPKEKLRYFSGKLTQNPISKIGWIDTSGKGTDNFSFPVGLIFSDGKDFKIYIDKVIYNKNDIDINEPYAVELINNERLDKVGYETNQYGTMGYKSLQKQVRTPVYGTHETTNKHSRIVAQASFIRQYVIFRNDYKYSSEYYFFMQDIYKYLRDGTSKNKVDAPDSLAGLMFLFRKMYNL